MHEYNPAQHHRRSIRLKGYDYAQAGLYFITICTQDKVCLFGRVEDGRMILNEFGKIAQNEWLKAIELRPNVTLHEYVVMPNHIHGIIEITRRGELYSPDDGTRDLPCDTPELHSPNNDAWDDLPDHDTMPDISPDHGAIHDVLFDNIAMPDGSPDDGATIGVLSHNDTTHAISPDHNAMPDGYDANDDKGECNSPLRMPLRGPAQTVGAIVRGYKSAVTKQLNALHVGRPVWQRNYYEHIIRDELSYVRIACYIMDNPSKWQDDTFYLA